MSMSNKLSCVAIAGLISLAGAAQAQVNWVPSSGSGTFFTYSGGFSDNGRFGNPTLVGDQFQFTPTTFAANSVNGVAASVPDRMQVDLVANPGQRFTMIRITEFGSWGITGIGSVNAFGSLNLVDMLNVRPPAITPLQTNPAMPVSTPNSSGVWQGSAVIDLTQIIGPNWTRLRLVFSNTLQATSGANSSALIDKKVVGGPSIFVDILPAPGSATLLGLGGLLAARRRRSA